MVHFGIDDSHPFVKKTFKRKKNSSHVRFFYELSQKCNHGRKYYVVNVN